MKTVALLDKQGFSADNAKNHGIAGGMITAGMIGGHVGLSFLGEKGKTLPVNLGVAAAGFAGAMYIKNPLAKFLLLGVGVYGTMRTLKLAVSGSINGFDGLGFLPEGIKEKISNFIPSLGEVDEENLLGEYDEEMDGLDNLGLDDELLGEDESELLGMGTEEVDWEDVTGQREISGLAGSML